MGSDPTNITFLIIVKWKKIKVSSLPQGMIFYLTPTFT